MDQNSISAIYNAFADHGPAIQAALMTGALELFGALAVIELTLSVGKSMAHKTDLLDIIYLVANQIIVIGFFLFLLQNWAGFAKNIIDSGASFGGLASGALGGTTTMMPIGIFTIGANMAGHIWAAISLTSPAMSILLVVNGIIVVGIFGYIAALMIELLIEGFFAAYIGVVMMAFGATVYTRDMAISQVRYAIAVAVKRLAMQLLVGVAEAIVNGWATKIQNNPASMTWTDMAVMIGIPIVLVRLAIRIPNVAQDVVMGSHLQTHGSLFTSGAVIEKAAVAAAIAATGAGAAIGAGATLASRQIGAQIAAGTAPSSRVGQAAKMMGMAASITGKALAADVGSRLTGNYAAAHGHVGWRVAAAISGKKKP